jgi:hypothetical protein
MKNQYFGDVRDLFKYDLIEHILKEMKPEQKGFTFIPMLTEYDPKNGDGNRRNIDRARKRGRPGTKNGDLVGFLEDYNEQYKRKYGDAQDSRDFTRIDNYFKRRSSLGVSFYRGHEHFQHPERSEYFTNIPKNLLHRPVVFVDPDIGLPVKKSNEKHLLYCEVKDIYARIGRETILMIYQHFPRFPHKHPEYCPAGRAEGLRRGVEESDLPLWVSDKEIFFLFLTHSVDLRNRLVEVIDEYRNIYPNLAVGPDEVKHRAAKYEM